MCLTCRYYNRFGLFRQAPLSIYFQIFFRRGTGQQESVTLGSARRWTLAPVVERAPGGLSRRGGVVRRTGERGEGGDGTAGVGHATVPGSFGFPSTPDASVGPISPLLAFQFAHSYPPPLSLGPLLGSPTTQKFF